MRKLSLLCLTLLLALSVIIACESGNDVTADTTDALTDAVTTENVTEGITDAATGDAETEPAVTLESENGEILTGAGIYGWFDYSSAMHLRDEFKVADRDSLAIGMAKNEMEGFQYILASTVDYEDLRLEVSTLSDGKGNALVGTVFIGQNIYVKKPEILRGYHPDALLEQDNPFHGGSFDLVAGRAKTLYVQYMTDRDTAPGVYTGTLQVKQGDTVLLTGEISLRVYDIYYDEKTECLNYFQYGARWDSMYKVPEGSPNMMGDYERMAEYCDFMIANRLSPFELPFADEILNPDAAKYMDNPRVNFVLLRNYLLEPNYPLLADYYRVATEKGWFNKIGFLSFDEPANETHMGNLLHYVGKINSYFPTTQHVNAFGIDLVKDGRNVVERFSDFSTTHCINTYPMAQNPHLYETMLRLKEERGDTLFWYVCGTQFDNFINLLPSTTGTAKRVLFWQQYQHDIDGFHYWHVNYWKAYDTIWEDDYEERRHKLLGTDAPPTGDGCLIYWDPLTQAPVGSLGLEAVRDGIEDFQLLRMAEKVLGKETVMDYTRRLTTSLTEYTTDAALLAQVKAELATALEAALAQ